MLLAPPKVVLKFASNEPHFMSSVVSGIGILLCKHLCVLVQLTNGHVGLILCLILWNSKTVAVLVKVESRYRAVRVHRQNQGRVILVLYGWYISPNLGKYRRKPPSGQTLSPPGVLKAY